VDHEATVTAVPILAVRSSRIRRGAREVAVLRTKLAVLLAAGTVAGTVAAPVAGPAAPARAAPGLVVVSVVSASDSATANAVADCPADHPVVHSAGGQVTDGLGYVVLTDAHATAGLRSVIAWGHENGPFSGSWSVSAFALCGPADRLALVSAGTASDDNPDKTVVAKCPAGTAVYGTGYELAGASGHVLPTVIRPDAGLSTLTVSGYASNGYAGNWTLFAHLVCGPRIAGMTLVTTNSVDDYVSPRTQPAGGCPIGMRRHGLGAEVTATADGDGYVGLNQVGSQLRLDHRRDARLVVVLAVRVTAHAICVP
jgi:hypothetical protein